MLPKIGATELILILVIALVIFGPSKLPEIGAAVGTSIKEFKNSLASISDKDDAKKTEEKTTAEKVVEDIEKLS